MESDICRVDGNNYEQSGNRFDLDDSGSIQQCGPERIADAEAVSVIGVEDGSNNAVELSCVVGERPQMPDGGSTKLVSGGESATAGGVAGTVIRKRKILRKTVRIIKKVIKKVPKRVLIGGTGIRGDMVKVEDVTGEEVDDLSAQMESETLKPVSNANVSDQTMSRNYQSGLYADDIKGNDAVCEVERNNGDLEIGEAKFTLGTINERENTVTENQLKDFLVENRRIDTVDKRLLTGESVGRIGEESGVVGEKENGSTIVKDESCSYEVESDRVKFTEGLLLSEEMEAVERQKKRKTEIFLGGLSKGTKEEDIRAVFEEVGVVVDVRLVVNPKTRKNRGFAFVRFATAADATNALLKYSRVEICGKLCNTAPVEGNDTIFLGNIDRNWKTEDFVKLLEKAGIEKIDKVTLKADPNNTERNRGFAFVELQTSKNAQTAFNKLQKKDAFGKNQVVKVAWATLNEPAEEEIFQAVPIARASRAPAPCSAGEVESVYAEYLPSSWDEEKVKEYFKRFGEIESAVLAKNLYSSMRSDFAVINYATRDAALACIEAVNRERLGDDCTKVKMAVSLVKPIPKRKQVRHTFIPTRRQHLGAKEKVLQTSKKLYLPRNNGKASSSSYDHVKAVSRPCTTSTTSTTEELVQLLRQQASSNHNPPYPGSGSVMKGWSKSAIMPDHRFLLPGSKRPFSQVGHEPLYMESQQLSRVRMENSYQFSGPSPLSHGVDLLLPPYHHQPWPGFPSESINGRRNYPSPFQTRDRASYYEDTNPYHRY